jgi:hypothetical protein
MAFRRVKPNSPAWNLQAGLFALTYLTGDYQMGNGGRTGCSCGSNLYSEWQFDALGIALCRTCDDCHKERMSHYRPEILSGYDQSDVDESIEAD